MGKELARIRHHAFADNDLLFNRFAKNIFENLSLGVGPAVYDGKK